MKEFPHFTIDEQNPEVDGMNQYANTSRFFARQIWESYAQLFEPISTLGEIFDFEHRNNGEDGHSTSNRHLYIHFDQLHNAMIAFCKALIVETEDLEPHDINDLAIGFFQEMADRVEMASVPYNPFS